LYELPGAPLEEQPFDATFTEEKVLRARDDTVTTSSSLMENPKLRRTAEGNAEAAAHSLRAAAPEAVKAAHTTAVAECEKAGYSTVPLAQCRQGALVTKEAG
jgi:hypothetical protein